MGITAGVLLLQGMAVKIVETVLKVGTEVAQPEQVDMLFDFIAPLVADTAETYEGDDDVRPCTTWLRTCVDVVAAA